MTYLTRRHLDRRRLLRGGGAALALPLFSAMTPALARRADEPETPLRMVFVYVPNGIIGDAWELDDGGAARTPLSTFSRTLEPLAPHAAHLRVVSGLAHDKGRANGDGPGDHARASGSYLTATQPFKGDGTRLSVAESVDQRIARALTGRTRLPSLSLAAEGGRLSGQCDSGYPCAYSNSLSWKSPHTPVPAQTNPGRVFDALVGDVRPGEDEATRARRLATRSSVLDYVREDAGRLAGDLGTADRVKLEEYLDAVRGIERRLARLAADGPLSLSGHERPDARPETHAERTALLFELLALALETDTTRVATVMIANEGSGRSYRNIDVRQGHHGLSHHKGDADWIESLRKINRHHVELFEPFVARLASTDEAGRSLLDSSAVLYGSGLSDGNRHRHEDLPLVVAGRLGGAITTGVHARHERETPMANLFVSLMRAFHVEVERFGDSNGALSLTDTV